MSWITWIILESKVALAIPLGTTLFVLLVHWRRGGRPRPLLIGLAITIALFTLQALIITKREHAGQALDAITVDLLDGRTTALQTSLAPSFQTEDLDRDAFLGYVANRLRQTDIIWAKRTRLNIESATTGSADCFVAVAGYAAEIRVSQIPLHIPSTWEITFEHIGDEWLIINIRCRSIGDADNPNWREISSSRLP